MGFNDILKKLFGNKSQRDLREIQPYVDRILAEYAKIESLDNDELRRRVTDIREQIQESVAPEKARIAEIKDNIESVEYDERENMWEEVDKIEKTILDKYEKALDDALPQVFALVKATAKRFAENEEIVVTATEFDRQLATTKDFVRIEGDKAIYQNHRLPRRFRLSQSNEFYNLICYIIHIISSSFTSSYGFTTMDVASDNSCKNPVAFKNSWNATLFSIKLFARE